MAAFDSSVAGSIIRKTSPSTGISYLSSSSSCDSPKRLWIFIHGWACTSLDFLPLLSTLTSMHPDSEDLYIAPDAPGHGQSPQYICPDPAVPSIARLIGRLHRELAETDIHNFVHSPVDTILVGHSMGCRIALEVYAHLPVDVTKIVLLDGSWYGPDPKDYKPRARSKDEELQTILFTFNTMLGPSTPEAFKQQVFQHLRELDLDYVGRLRKAYISWDGERMEIVMNMIREGQLVGEKTVSPTVLVVQGTEGHGTGRHSLIKGEEGPWMNFVRDRIGNQYNLLIVEGSGHWPHVDKVEEVAVAIREFARPS